MSFLISAALAVVQEGPQPWTREIEAWTVRRVQAQGGRIIAAVNRPGDSEHVVVLDGTTGQELLEPVPGVEAAIVGDTHAAVRRAPHWIDVYRLGSTSMVASLQGSPDGRAVAGPNRILLFDVGSVQVFRPDGSREAESAAEGVGITDCVATEDGGIAAMGLGLQIVGERARIRTAETEAPEQGWNQVLDRIAVNPEAIAALAALHENRGTARHEAVAWDRRGRRLLQLAADGIVASGPFLAQIGNHTVLWQITQGARGGLTTTVLQVTALGRRSQWVETQANQAFIIGSRFYVRRAPGRWAAADWPDLTPAWEAGATNLAPTGDGAVAWDDSGVRGVGDGGPAESPILWSDLGFSPRPRWVIPLGDVLLAADHQRQIALRGAEKVAEFAVTIRGETLDAARGRGFIALGSSSDVHSLPCRE